MSSERSAPWVARFDRGHQRREQSFTRGSDAFAALYALWDNGWGVPVALIGPDVTLEGQALLDRIHEMADAYDAEASS